MNKFKVKNKINNGSMPVIEIKQSDNKEQSILRTFIDVYNEFASETSIHGLKYTTQRKLKLDGFIWLTIMSMSIISAGFLANRFYDRHRAASMRTTVVSTQYPAWELNLPAVTLCHGTMVRKEKLENFLNSRGTILPRGISRNDLEYAVGYLREAIEPTNRFSAQLNTVQRVLEDNAMTVEEFLQKIGPNCSEYLIICTKESREESCDSLMSPSVTPYGICCSFNYRFSSRKKERNKRDLDTRDYHSVTYGSRTTLSFLMNPYLGDRISSTFYGDGIKVLIHEPYSYPGSSSLEFVSPSRHETIASVLGNRLVSSDEVLNLSENVRSCIKTEDQIPPYRSSNCFAKCRERVIKSACKCLPFYAFLDDDDTKQCNLSHNACLARKIIRAGELKLDDTECGCLPECEETTYTLRTTTIPLNAPEFSPSPLYRETSKLANATTLHITLASQIMTLQRRDVVQSWINLLSSLGGVFSLFLGCSFISLFEIVYFFFICLPNKLRCAMKRNGIF